MSYPSGQPVSIPELRAAVKGTVTAPGDPGYDQARKVFYGWVDRHPAAVVRVADAEDVARVVTLARDTGAELAVRSGGHSVAGHGTSEGGIVIDLSNLRSIDIDPKARTAWAGTGLTAADYTNAVGEHGLATGFGDTGSVGIGGITLGGGVGFLTRKYGLTIDHLLAAEIVTADGRVRVVDADNEPDLFWAIRGGGGNFGVATRFKFQLHPVDQIVGGMLMLPATPDVIRGFVAEAEAAPEELSAIANVMVAPPAPFIPPELHGKLLLMILLVHCGPVEEGEKAVAPFRALATPVADQVGPMRYGDIFKLMEGPPDVAEESGHTAFMDTVDDRAAEAIVQHLQASTAMMSLVQLRVLGGAAARVPADATAYAHRDRPVMVVVGAIYMDPGERSVHDAWVRAVADDLSRGATGAYVNFLGRDGAERIREAYPGGTWDRLTEIKRRYDPTNVFRLNQNIPPSPNGTG